jgi:hypothetical protein
MKRLTVLLSLCMNIVMNIRWCNVIKLDFYFGMTGKKEKDFMQKFKGLPRQPLKKRGEL